MRELRSRRAISAAIAGAALLIAFVAFAAPASAHADFLGSDPADEELLTGPVTEIELRFSATVYPDLSRGRLLDADGQRLETTVFQRSDDHLIVQPAEALTDGLFALVWETASEDGHQVEGALRFIVDSGATVQAGRATTTTAPPTTAGSSVESPPTTFTPTRPPVAAQPASTSMDVVIDTSPSAAEQLAGLLEGLGRFVSLLGGMLAIGAAAFAAFALVGTVAEIRRTIGWIRAAGALLVVGTLTQVLMLAAASEGAGVLLDPVGILEAIPTGLAASAVLRIAGGVALMQAPTLVTVMARRPDAVPVGADASATVTTIDREGDEPRRLVVREEWLLLAGLAAVAISYLLDGHSASLGVPARAANLVHVVAGGVWLGGVIVLGDLALQRRRRNVPTRLAESAVRFSRVATVALIAVAVAGSGLLWSILENPADLPSRAWGRLLLGKIVLVAVAAGIGAFNHYRVVPRLERDPDQAATLSRTLRAEGIVLVLVMIVTAALVVAAP